MNKNKTPLNILVTIPVNDERRARIDKAAAGNKPEYIPLGELKKEDVHDRDIIIGNIPLDFVPYANNLKWLQLNMSGYEGYPEAVKNGVFVTNTRGAFGLAISEHMIGMLLMLIKKLHRYRDNQRESLWHDEGGVTSIEDATVLTVGLGNIGSDFARKVKAMGAYTIGIRRNISEKPDYIDEIYTLSELDKLLPRADVVALSVPSNDETKKLMNKERLALMKQGAVLMNVGRGNAIDTDALYEAVHAGRIMAALDVTDPEPLPENHPLWRERDALITPHISGFYHLPQTVDRIIGIATENLTRFLNGEALKNVVN